MGIYHALPDLLYDNDLFLVAIMQIEPWIHPIRCSESGAVREERECLCTAEAENPHPAVPGRHYVRQGGYAGVTNLRRIWRSPQSLLHFCINEVTFE
jgi:hypothetical protein